MKFLIIEGFLHHKNKIGLINILNFLKYEYKFGSIADIDDFNIIYSPTDPIDTSKYPTKKFIMGPHFSVFPDENKLKTPNSKNPINGSLDVMYMCNMQKTSSEKLLKRRGFKLFSPHSFLRQPSS